jgi:hypothetical protein
MEERTKNFINTVIFVSRIFSGLKDKFLARKLYDKLSEFISAYVAQSEGGDIKVATDALLDLLDYLEHSKAVGITPLLYARRNLFAFKLQLMRVSARPQKAKSEAAYAMPAPKPLKKEINLSGNKEKILNYIKRSPNSRTKDIIYEFSVLSERTVKRNLKELVGDGLLQRVSKDKAVYYRLN